MNRGTPRPGSPAPPRLVVANWKMHKTPREAESYLSEFLPSRSGFPQEVRLAIAPGFPCLERVGRLLRHSPFLLAAQDLHAEHRGAFTGEVSAEMLHDLDVRLVLVGHSERRRQRHEEEKVFALKMARAVDAGLAPIYCVGESLEEREANQTEQVLRRQLSALDAFAEAPPRGLALAYEPVWAIGTGRAATPPMVADAHRFLRRILALRYGEATARTTLILYGGSVTPENAKPLFAQSEVDGALVGGASLVAPDFAAIVRMASRGPTEA